MQRGGSGARTGTEEPERGGGRVVPAVRALGAVLLAAHLALATWLMLRPLAVPWVYNTNVRPFATIERLLFTDSLAGVRMILTGLVLLAPLGVLLPLVSGKLNVSTVASCVRTVFLGAAVSFVIECLQTGVPGQVFDVDSLLLNTAGVAMAHLAVVPGARAWLRRRRAAGAEPADAAVARVRTTKGTTATTSYEVAAPRSG